jgi:hypothetical protein
MRYLLFCAPLSKYLRIRKERKKERKKEGKKERRKERKKERRKERKKERKTNLFQFQLLPKEHDITKKVVRESTLVPYLFWPISFKDFRSQPLPHF